MVTIEGTGDTWDSREGRPPSSRATFAEAAAACSMWDQPLLSLSCPRDGVTEQRKCLQFEGAWSDKTVTGLLKIFYNCLTTYPPDQRLLNFKNVQCSVTPSKGQGRDSKGLVCVGLDERRERP